MLSNLDEQQLFFDSENVAGKREEQSILGNFLLRNNVVAEKQSNAK